MAGFFKLADVSALYAAVGEGTVGAQSVVNRLIAVEGGDETVAEEISEDRVVTGRRRRSSGAIDCGIRVIGASELAGQVGEVLYAGAGRRHSRLRDSRLRHFGAPTRLQQCGQSAGRARTSYPGGVGAERQELVPGGDSDRGPGPESAVVRHHPMRYRTSTSTSCRRALTTSKDRICRAKFTFETADPTHLDHVLRAVRGVPAVYEAYRIQQ